ncbi:LppU/SCO3897 family protein [Micromonospora sp. DT31]|uniref:LppU/SCO3897 family protein n=1 Tax=Micromonospora sp. DT31 TaxID=3393434 RepID=UPI003CE7B148
MTSEAPHRPGQEPGEVSPGTGGPVPYGDQPAQQDNGYDDAPDLGWAPPPPTGRPGQPAPTWAANDGQPAAWTPPAGPPVTGRATAQVPPSADPHGRAPQPGWGAPEQGGPTWPASGQGNPAWAATEQPAPDRAEPTPPAWGGEQSRPAWGTGGPSGEQSSWPQQADGGARGTGYVPAPATVPNESWAAPAPAGDPNRSGGFAAGAHDDAPGRSGGWATGAPPEDPGRAGGWTPRNEQPAPADDPNRSGGWTPRESQPAWSPQPGQQTGATWPPAEPPARAAASVPGVVHPEHAWPATEQSDQDNARPGPAGADDDPNRSGGWRSSGGQQPDEARRSGGWPTSQADDRAGNWDEPGRDEDPDRSGGWAAGRAARPAPQPGGWGEPDQPRQAGGWSGAASVPQQREPGHPGEEPARPTWGAAAPNEAPARASASVPAPDAPAGWGGNQDDPAPERPAVPNVEPWSSAEAWGRAEEAAPAYQPAPAPGVSPGNAVPLPAQQQRVPGAALAASAPADHPAEPQRYEPEHGEGGWDSGRSGHEEPPSAVVPGPRTSPEAGPVSASASVPVSSRVTPPSDQPLPTGAPTPQPRVYGRPAQPEPEETPEEPAYGFAGREQPARGFPGPDGPSGFDQDNAPDFPGPGPQSRSADPDGAYGYADAPSSSPAAGPPAFPADVPSFVDPPGNYRPTNGVHPGDEQPGGSRDAFGGPQSPYGGRPDGFGGPGGRPDPFGSPGGQQDAFGGPGGQQDGFGGPGGRPDPFGGPGDQRDPFGGPSQQYGSPAGGRASVSVPGQRSAGDGGFPSSSPQGAPSWPQDGPVGDQDQGRFDAFKPDAEPPAEAPPPKVRNGRVLAAVLVAAVLILAVPLGLLTLLGKVGDDDKPAGFDPAVGSCVKQSGQSAVAVDCGEQGAFSVVSKVDNKDKCTDLSQPSVAVEGSGGTRVLCLKPAGQ